MNKLTKEPNAQKDLTSEQRIIAKAGQKLGETPSQEYPFTDVSEMVGTTPSQEYYIGAPLIGGTTAREDTNTPAEPDKQVP